MLSFESFYRKNYELWMSLAWLLSATFTPFFLIRLNIPNYAIILPVTVSSIMFLLRGYQALKVGKDRSRICTTENGEEVLSLAQLLKFIEKIPKIIKHKKRDIGVPYTWYGKGFEWSPEHLRKTREIMGSGSEKLTKHTKYGKYNYWIHAIGHSQEDNIFSPSSLESGHRLIVGTTGAGKTKLYQLLISQAIYRDEVVYIIDPKGDYDLEKTARLCAEKLGKPYYYFHPTHPEKSIKLDPLFNWNRPTELASRIAAILPSENKGDPFTAFSWHVLNSFVQGIIYIEERPDLMSIKQLVEDSPVFVVLKAMRLWCRKNNITGIDTQLEKAKPSKGVSLIEAKVNILIDIYHEYIAEDSNKSSREAAVDGLINVFKHNRDHFSKMIASLIPILDMLTSGSLEGLLSPSRFDNFFADEDTIVTNSAEMIDSGGVIYIGLDNLSDSTVGSAIGSLLLADLTAIAGARYIKKGESPEKNLTPINVFIDEAAEVINTPTIQLMNKGRGAGFKMSIATQTLADFEVRTGSDAMARQILGNVNSWIALRIQDPDTQDYLAKKFPMSITTSLEQGYLSQIGSGDSDEFGATYSEKLKQEEGELFPPYLLGMLPNFHYVVKFADSSMYKGKLPRIENQ